MNGFIYTVEYGPLIYQERIKQELTQKELAEGICSIPYLSKIENNKIKPNHEIIMFLLQKLNISIKGMQNDYDIFQAQLSNWYNYLVDRNHQQIEISYSLLKNTVQTINNSDLSYAYSIVLLRYYLYKRDLEMAKGLVENLTKHKNKMKHFYLCYLEYFTGIYKCLLQDYQEGLAHLCAAESQFHQERIPIDPELSYHLSLTYSNLSNTSMALHHGYESLNGFSKQMRFSRCLECHLIIGINQTRLKNYKAAFEQYENIIKSSQQFNMPDIEAKALHNIGFLHNKQENYEEAARFFELSLSLKEENTNSYLNTLYYLINSLTHSNNRELALPWLDRGIVLGNKYSLSKAQLLKLEMLKYEWYSTVKEEGLNAYFTFLSEQCIPFFKEKKDLVNLGYCYSKAAKIAYEKRSYKHSSELYRLAYETTEKN